MSIGFSFLFTSVYRSRFPKATAVRFNLWEDFISCVLWEGRFYVTGTDIVKYITWRFRMEDEPVGELKKFEEGIFSDLRNLKPGSGAVLEEPRSPFLEFLFKIGAIRTHKKQKVFFWEAVQVSQQQHSFLLFFFCFLFRFLVFGPGFRSRRHLH